MNIRRGKTIHHVLEVPKYYSMLGLEQLKKK